MVRPHPPYTWKWFFVCSSSPQCRPNPKCILHHQPSLGETVVEDTLLWGEAATASSATMTWGWGPLWSALGRAPQHREKFHRPVNSSAMDLQCSAPGTAINSSTRQSQRASPHLG
ncbi:hypothetical protein CRENBAI_002382 [Crenichthys baileyi]|uniref:Uncharacterized protein n=1 Tax=Crenichthys baileyi TaxID=28760 RepID=A0AAV9S8I3_9TELE